LSNTYISCRWHPIKTFLTRIAFHFLLFVKTSTQKYEKIQLQKKRRQFHPAVMLMFDLNANGFPDSGKLGQKKNFVLNIEKKFWVTAF
jgi:hypothetical protein